MKTSKLTLTTSENDVVELEFQHENSFKEVTQEEFSNVIYKLYEQLGYETSVTFFNQMAKLMY